MAHCYVASRVLSLALLPGLLFGNPAFAELPDAAKQMITTAAREGSADELATITKFARRTYPNESVKIDNLLLATQNARASAAQTKTAPTTSTLMQQTELPESIVRWSGKGNVGGFHNSGNTDSFGITVGANLLRKGTRVSHLLRLRGDYQESSGAKSREYFNSAYQSNWTIGDEHYALGIMEYERDILAGFDHRATSSLGLGWRAIRGNAVSLSLEAGPAYRHDWYRSGAEKSSLAARGALTSSWQMNDKVRLSQNMELVSEDQINTLRTLTGLQAKLTDRISSQISYDLRYQDRPVFGKEGTDTITRIGLTYDF